MSPILKRIEVVLPVILGIGSYGMLLGALILSSGKELLPLSFAEFLGQFFSNRNSALVFTLSEYSLLFLLCLLPGAMFCIGTLGYIRAARWAFNAGIAALVALTMHAYLVSVPRLSSHPDALSVSLFIMEASLLFLCYFAAAKLGSRTKKRLTTASRRTP